MSLVFWFRPMRPASKGYRMCARDFRSAGLPIFCQIAGLPGGGRSSSQKRNQPGISIGDCCAPGCCSPPTKTTVRGGGGKGQGPGPVLVTSAGSGWLSRSNHRSGSAGLGRPAHRSDCSRRRSRCARPSWRGPCPRSLRSSPGRCARAAPCRRRGTPIAPPIVVDPAEPVVGDVLLERIRIRGIRDVVGAHDLPERRIDERLGSRGKALGREARSHRAHAADRGSGRDRRANRRPTSCDARRK